MAQLKSTNVTGNLSATGSILAPKFIKLGGTSSGFLKADGSVDTTAYTTNTGTVTSIAAGTGLSGGTITTTGTISLDVAGAKTALGLGSAAYTNSEAYATSTQGTNADTAHGWGNHAGAGYLTSTWNVGVTQNSNSGVLFNNGNAKLKIYNTSASPTDYAAIELRSTNTTKRTLFIDTDINSVVIGAASSTADTTYKFKVAGTVGVTGQLTSTVANGTAPFVVTSSTKVSNLNVDQLDGIDSTGFALTPKTGATSEFALTGPLVTGGNNTLYYNGSVYVNTSGQVNAPTFRVGSAVTLEYNTGTKSLDFNFS